jgi:ubiquinone/menaquinone biosynthesis C-methylase UbiE
MSDNKHGHIHHSKSTKDILNADEVLKIAGIKSDDNFLDAGCGDGFISIAASQKVGDTGRIHALDAYPESIELVEDEIKKLDIKNLEALVADLTDKIPLNDDSIDLCIMANVLHGFVQNNELKEAMGEINRVIKTGGIFAVVEFKKEEGTRGPPMESRITPQQVKEIMENYGFEYMDDQKVGNYHYLLRAKKR